MLKKTQAFLIILIFMVTYSHSQMGFEKIEDVKNLSNKTLLVATRNINPEIVKYLKEKKRKKQLDIYLSEIESYNNALKEQFTSENWTYTKDFKFIEESKIEYYDKNSNRDEYVLFYNDYQKSKQKFTIINIIGQTTTDYIYKLKFTGRKKPSYMMPYSTSFTNKADMKFIIQQTKLYIKKLLSNKGNKKDVRFEGIAAESSKQLKTKTLLLDKNEINTRVLKKLDELYKYPTKLTDRNEIDEAILTERADVLFLRILPEIEKPEQLQQVKASELIKYEVDYHYSKHIYNPENGAIVSTASGPFKPGNFLPTVRNENTLNVIELKNMINLIEQ